MSGILMPGDFKEPDAELLAFATGAFQLGAANPAGLVFE